MHAYFSLGKTLNSALKQRNLQYYKQFCEVRSIDKVSTIIMTKVEVKTTAASQVFHKSTQKFSVMHKKMSIMRMMKDRD